MGSHQNGDGAANAAKTAKEQALLFNITGMGKGGNSNTGTVDVGHGGMVMKKKVTPSRLKKKEAIMDLVRHSGMMDYRALHAKAAACAAARAPEFAATKVARLG
jgi:hypothetical protein